MFMAGGWVFIESPPLAVASNNNAARIALDAYNKLMSQSFEPFRLKAARPHSLFIDKHGIDSEVSTDHATPAPHAEL